MANYWQRSTARKVNRRAFLRRGALAGVGAAAFALAACGGGETKDAGSGSSQAGAGTAAAGTPKQGGVVKVGHPSLQNFDALDPRGGSTQGAGLITSNHYRGSLLSVDNKGNYAGGVAAKWETPDDTTYILTLVDGAKFHDGTPVDAEAVKWSIERHNPANPKYPPNSPPPQVLPSKVEATDPKTVRITLAKAYPPFLFQLTKYGMGGGTLSMKAHAQPPGDPYGYESGADSKPITPGPFKVNQLVQKQSLELGRFDQYYAGPPYLDKIIYRPVTEDGTRVTLLRTGEADIIANVPPQEIDGFKADSNFVVDSRPGQKVLMMKINMLKPPFGPGNTDRAVKFRQAMLYAIDREAIIKSVLGGQGSVADSPLIPSQIYYAPTKKYPFDPQKARQLLTEAGWDFSYHPQFAVGEGFAPAARDVALAIGEMLKKVGMEPRMDIWGDYGALVTATGRKAGQSDREKWDFTFSAWSMVPEPSERIASIDRSANGLTLYDDPTLDKMLDDQLYVGDAQKKKQAMIDIQAYHMEKLPYIPLYYQFYTSAWRKKLQGVVVEDTESWDLTRAWLQG